MKFYLTSAIPYVNAKPHVGHALEFMQGDVLARYHRAIGDSVRFLCGSDENALKNVQAAEKAGVSVEEFCAQHATEFENLAKHLNVQFDVFQRSSSPQHHTSSQKLWELCHAAGDIYKKKYQGLYCVGCEAFYTRDELNENGECFEHPGKPLELVEEENYFFKLSKYKEQITKLIKNKTINIVPKEKESEVLGFLKGEVLDISISRSRARAKNWGVEVPGDPSQIIYVWFDALNVYQSGIGFGTDDATYKKWWPADAHVIGKGIIKFHAVYWPAMLLSAKLALPKNLYVHGYITVNGQKMSKSLGNVVDPEEVIAKFGTEAVRYYFLREMSTTEDGDFSIDRLHETYEAHLANELGNLISRVAKLCDGGHVSVANKPTAFSKAVVDGIEAFNYRTATDDIWNRLAELNKTVSAEKPWEKTAEERAPLLIKLVQEIAQIGFDLQPFLPATAEKILAHFGDKEIVATAPMFPRIAK
ncbi:MAG TPA: methionine--tRNA ligase [Candidatus Saccharimonadia bacterium]|nr:methionine--tRNA ligase [Candidatus Saccharimonadia bacterium]